MKKILQLIATAALAGSAATALADQNGTITKYTYPLNPKLGSLPRYYKVYKPANYNKANPTALVVVLHAGGLSYLAPLTTTQQQSVWSTYGDSTLATPTKSIADASNLIIAVPNGFDPTSSTGRFDAETPTQTWNDCTGNYKGYKPSGGTLTPVDDVAFIKGMITQIEADTTHYNIDPKKVYAAGVSNGGLMALRLARELPDVIAGVGAAAVGDGSTGSSMQLSDQCAYAPTLSANGQSWIANPQPNPVPIWMIKGTLDSWVVYTGGLASSNSGSWWLPYETGYTGNQTDPNVCYSPTNATTIPANTTSQSLLALRYGLNPTPSSTYTYSGATKMYCQAAPANSGNSILVTSTVSCKNYVNSVTARSEVDDCTVPYGGHIEPSNLVVAALSTQAVFGNQNITLDTATEEWKFFQRFTHP